MKDEVKKKSSSRRSPRSSLIPPPSSLPSSRAKKSLGQNFLTDERVAARIVEALGPRADEAIIEIGPGQGALTSRLLERAGRLFAVELDFNLAQGLREQFAANSNFHLLEADALATDFCALIAPDKSARLVANLPYNISTAILQRLIRQRACIPEMVLMLQREVVERITAPPASTERGYLSVLVEAYCEREALFDVAPQAFRPVPKIWSTVVRLTVCQRPAVEVEDEELLWRLVSAGFAQRRKTIFNNLRSISGELSARLEKSGGPRPALEAAHIAPNRRAETLTLEEWAALARTIEQAEDGR
ncbi:MAG TPA: 16S rRNA (adenine(1518)-N(6)/adenine(1519)-N(6))-dimethyltransferase RsmA [Pyrinomonadaceae bacterium]|jgi:16S rRNA (adenine1518-N6/adenine1519-N6)-dimethyltransferase|nr:16S rRNA (adenine(1518)-N(6)/adenine(1519)-N(6))-dimethyltransferase RsmA [Pyrinomonadaceae bacterium]